ncbi:hypothetical protein [Tenacibaculum jejuense]|uniref:Probable lipoprotein n=1 Tax=Tenacibaculum jejuense TaxID=584609 RepID=A0A238UC45_9FLAO|nr:hypothetical protein [Tenacibaculum jejuense]SNR16044.1 Probable lipoprotein precursor [Tenacibaculum jejuense]
MTLKKPNPKFEITLVVIFIIVLLMSCKKKTTPVEVNISYNLPVDVPINATQEELANFAWEEFFALNWKSSWEKDGLRTKPDTSWDYQTDNGENFLSVWETYIHRAELRPANGTRTKDLSSGKPYYTFVDFEKVNTINPVNLDNYWNVLDEDNEIGSAYVFAHKNQFEVLYAAKTNLVEYNYLKDYFPTDTDLYKAIDKSNDSTSFRNRLKGLSLKEMCNSDLNSKDGYVCLPCSEDNQNEGAIEIKLAFRELDPTKDDASRYMVKEVVYFRDSIVDKQKYSNAFTKQFALIGMHIIRKTKNHPTFIFASWEQVDERNKDTQTIGIDAVTVNNKEYTDVDPHRLNPVIERVIPETLQTINSKVHKKIIKNNNQSKWQYYQLIGVQGKPIDYKDRNSDNNYFMANFVIESDLKLTNFHGSFGDPFDTKVQNIISDGKEFNMGGCMGCHGQAQSTFGTDFSFLLDSGAGKPVVRPDPYQTFEEAITAAQKDEIEEIIKELKKQ